MLNLLWLDLETTGLDPQKGFILEVGTVWTTRTPWLEAEGDGYSGRSWVLPFDLHAYPNIDANVLEMHTHSGLNDECKRAMGLGVPNEYKGALEYVENSILNNVLTSSTDVENVYLAGSSVHFDLAWIRLHMPRIAARVSYRVYDVSAVLLFCRSLGMPKPEESKDKPHRALPDLAYSIALAKRCAEWLGTQKDLSMGAA